MKPNINAIIGGSALLCFGTTWADTIAYWRFEGDGVSTPTAGTQIEDSNGRSVTTTGVGIRAVDASGNGNTIWAWEHAWAGHTYEPGVPWSSVPQTGTPNGFFAKNAGDYPALFTWSNQSSPIGTNLDTWTSLTWTIEASFYTTALGAYRTVVGREGNGVETANANAAPLYFQMQNNNRFRIAYVDASGVTRSVEDSSTLTTNQWYSYAATCDGLTLKLYRKGPADTAVVMVGSLDVSTSANAALINPGNDINGQPWGWTVGRGRYGTSDDPGQNHGDRWFGGIDEVRISNVALDPGLLLAAPNAADSDNDGLPSVWETAHGLDPNDDGTGDPNNGASGDPDEDLASNADEYAAGSDPQNPASTPADTDADGLDDIWEQTHFGNLGQTGTADPDGDYATNEEEENAATNPNLRIDAPDSDTDGIGDAWEVHYFTNTTTATDLTDHDADTVLDLDEFLNRTDPTDATNPFSGTNPITWTTPSAITDDSQILASGDLLHAGNFRSDNATIDITVGSETVSFENRLSQNETGTLQLGEEARIIAGSEGRQVNAGLFDATGTTVSTAFESVLDGSAWENTDPGPAPGATDMILRVTGTNGDPLVAGQQYQIQLFCSDDRPTSAGRGQIFHDDVIGGLRSEIMMAGDSMAVTGTFIADGSGYQDIHIQNSTGGENFPVAINAYVLRTVPADNDADDDGMDDTWETTHFGDISQTGGGDFDADGTDNLTEYRLGLHPGSGSSRFAVTRGTAGQLEWPSAPGVSFTVQRSENLTGWTDIATIPGTAGTASYTDPAPPTGQAFYRILLKP